MMITGGQKVTLRDVNHHRAQFELPEFLENLDGTEVTFEERVHCWHRDKDTGTPTWMCRVSGAKVTRKSGPGREPETGDIIHCLIPETAMTAVDDAAAAADEVTDTHMTKNGFITALIDRAKAGDIFDGRWYRPRGFPDGSMDNDYWSYSEPGADRTQPQIMLHNDGTVEFTDFVESDVPVTFGYRAFLDTYHQLV